MTLQLAVVVMDLFVAQSEDALVSDSAGEGFVPVGLEVWPADTIDRFGGLNVGERDFVRSETYNGTVLLVQGMDVVDSVASEDFIL